MAGLSWVAFSWAGWIKKKKHVVLLPSFLHSEHIRVLRSFGLQRCAHP